MKPFKTAIIAVFVAALIVPAVAFIAVPRVEAACSFQGFISSGGKCAKSYKNIQKSSKRIDEFSNRNDALMAYIEQLIALLTFLQEFSDVSGGTNGTSFDSEIDITTRSAKDIDDDSARLRGEIDFNDSDTAEVWFEYGTSRTRLNSDTSKIDLDDDDSENFSRTISGLNDDTRYFFRAMGEDEDGEEDRGSILSFHTTDLDDGRDSDPDVTTDEAEDVTEDSAELNGSVDMNDFDNGRVFFVYGEDEDQVEDIANDFDTYAEIDEDGDNLQKVLRDSDLDDDEDYTYDAENLDGDTAHYFSMCVEYENEDDDDVITCGSVRDFVTGEDNGSDIDPTASTEPAESVTEDTATLNGSVDMNDFNNGRVFFVYGTDENQVEDVPNDFDTYTSVDEDGANLQKVLRDTDLDGNDDYTYDATSLDADTPEYFSMCVEYEDEGNNDLIVCGSVLTFTTGTTQDERPTANTDDVDDVATSTAELNGSVDMNDFDNGLVFFVYGTDESEVGSIATDYSDFASVPEDDALSKVNVDSDLDGVDSYAEDVADLTPNTEYFSSICVEFENSDNGDELVCGDVERLITDSEPTP